VVSRSHVPVLECGPGLGAQVEAASLPALVALDHHLVKHVWLVDAGERLHQQPVRLLVRLQPSVEGGHPESMGKLPLLERTTVLLSRSYTAVALTTLSASSRNAFRATAQSAHISRST